ncbi:MAG: NAD-dependent methanol dehydrogenase [Alphaproteobacteria bacterium MarineAlpha5_Bin11]|nr:MAG: NAD-dependent methanol dehydrogenase [Alphaproteobacteria bacterium MarineAlpha5_Bin11]|tara:strand:+ start:14405 stop:15589 length:1185 start_codon:yes stop_codon:yes gene_type:complete
MNLFFKELSSTNWSFPTTIWFGKNRSNELHNACAQLKITKPLLVTDPGLAKSSMLDTLLKELKNNNIDVKLFYDLRPNPIGANVKNGVDYFNNNNCDGVIAFGGGSGLDTGKAIAFMANQKRPLWDFEDIGDNWKRASNENIKPIIAIPTAAGTGSETGRASVFINEETQEKKIIFHPKMLPEIVILDPALTVGLPQNLTAATGMDALAHSLEAYCSPFFHPMAEGIALECIRIIKECLPRVYENGKDITARGYMLVASSMGSTAFQKGLGAIHSLSHPVNSIYNTHHGLTNAVFMPYVLIKNRKAIEDKIVLLSKFIGLRENSFDSFIKWILDIRKQLNIPNTIKEIGVDPQDFDKLSKMAKVDPSTASNPISLSEDEFIELYKSSYYGKLDN